MVAYWRQAGVSYIRFSSLCANALRAAMKPQFQSVALKAAEANVKVHKPKPAA
ncbi:ATP synthase subunit epsilon, mitochondrial [Anoplopoma fimbria]|uniref:ATP synthase subunit epsilon, mitochondrial n=1 Tax=Anoplopoma fimbria TaxID=229290 RepID=UPI0023EC9CFD|nr:ATP synthase subunit epsilon, mitochondrial [Anoplopoma fimbria]